MAVNHARFLIGAIALALAAPVAAQAQYLDPRAAQAIALCNSPAGAAIADCAKLRAMTGGAVPGVAVNPANANAVAGLLGALTSNVAGNPAAAAGIAGALLGAAQNAQAPLAEAYGGGQHNDAAQATYAAGRAYQACVAANPNNWQMCVQQMQNSPQNQAAAAIAASQQAALLQMQTPEGQQRYAACVRQYGAPNANNAALIQGCFFGPAQGAAIAQVMTQAGAAQQGYPQPGLPLPGAAAAPASADPFAAIFGK